MRIPPDFRIDPNKRLSEIAREFAKLIGVAGGNFLYNGKFLPEDKTLRELNIDPNDFTKFTFMSISFGPVNEMEENRVINRNNRGTTMFVDREWANQLPDNPGVYIIFDFDNEPLIIGAARNLRRDILHRIRNDTIRNFNDIDTYIDKKLLSGGTEDQILLALRVAFAMSLLPQSKGHYPKFLFLDESFSSSDSERRLEILNWLTDDLSSIFSQIIIISHQQEIIDNIPFHYKLSHGKIIEKIIPSINN